ncbi:hypothetical protein JCM10207_004985 [Rhodosporidiobolus poonsookiae]
MTSQSSSTGLFVTLSDVSTLPPVMCKQFARAQGPVQIGRAGRNDSAAHDPTSGKFRSDDTKVMSSRHAEITWSGGHACVADLGSTNGTVLTRDGEDRKLMPGASYRIKQGDLLTFGRQVAGAAGKVMCKPVVLVVGYTDSPRLAIPLSSSTNGRSFARLPASAALSRSRTLTERLSREPSTSDDEDDYLRATSKTTSTKPSKHHAGHLKRHGFGLSEDDVLDSNDELEEGNKTFDASADFRSTQMDRPESANSLAAASNVDLRGSPIPGAKSNGADAGEDDCDDQPQTLKMVDRSASPWPAFDGESPESASQLAKDSSARLPSPVSPETNAVRKVLRKPSTPPLPVLIDSMDSPIQAEEDHILHDENDVAAESSEVENEPLPILPLPSSLFSRPGASTSASPAPSQAKKAFPSLPSDDDAMSVSSHLPSPALSAESVVDSEVELVSDAEHDPDSQDDQDDQKENDDVLAVADDSDMEQSAEPEEAPKADFLADLVEGQRELTLNFAAFRRAAAAYKTDDPTLPSADLDLDLDADVSLELRPATPPGRDFSPELDAVAIPASSPLPSHLIDDFLDDRDEQEILVREAESEEPRKDIEVDEPPQEVGADLVIEEEHADMPPLVSDGGDVDLVVEQPDSTSSTALTPVQTDAESLDSQDAADVEVDMQDDDELDPDLDEVDLDVDGAVGKDVDTGLSDFDLVEDIDNEDGLGAEQHRWEDGVSEKLEQAEKVQAEKAASTEEEDDGYTSEGVACAPHAFAPGPPSLPAVFVPISPRLPLLVPSSSSTSSPRKRALAETESAQLSPTDEVSTSGGKERGHKAEKDAEAHTLRKIKPLPSSAHQQSLSQLEDIAAALSLDSVRSGTPAEATPVPIKPSVFAPVKPLAFAPNKPVAAISLDTLGATEAPPQKRRRLGFSLKSFAVGVVAGAVATVGGLSALGSLLEEQL